MAESITGRGAVRPGLNKPPDVTVPYRKIDSCRRGSLAVSFGPISSHRLVHPQQWHETRMGPVTAYPKENNVSCDYNAGGLKTNLVLGTRPALIPSTPSDDNKVDREEKLHTASSAVAVKGS